MFFPEANSELHLPSHFALCFFPKTKLDARRKQITYAVLGVYWITLGPMKLSIRKMLLFIL